MTDLSHCWAFSQTEDASPMQRKGQQSYNNKTNEERVKNVPNLRVHLQSRIVVIYAKMSNFDEMLELPGLLFYLGSQKYGGRGNDIAMKL